MCCQNNVHGMSGCSDNKMGNSSTENFEVKLFSNHNNRYAINNYTFAIPYY